MALYEMQTLIATGRVSRISYGEFPNDIAAILAARTLVPKGTCLEVWRGTVLVYRFGPPLEMSQSSESQIEDQDGQ